MWGDVREASDASERFSSIRSLLLAGVLASGLILGGCGGSSEEEGSVEEPTAEETTEATMEKTSVERTTEETTESTTQRATTTSSNEQAAVEIEVDAAPEAKVDATPEAKVEPPAVNCAGFGSGLGAQQFFDFNATPEQRAQLDPEGDGFACSVGNPAVNSAQPAPPTSSSPGETVPPGATPSDCIPSCQGAAIRRGEVPLTEQEEANLRESGILAPETEVQRAP